MTPPPLPLEEAQARLLALVEPLAVEHVDAPGARGRYLAEPLVAHRTNPGADLSAMDGYAVRSADLAGPWRIVGESAAGRPFGGSVGVGQAVRISTGAIVPDGADAVVVQEDVDRQGDSLALTGEPPSPPDKHLRRVGIDFHSGSELLPAGSRIGPAQLALAISAGHRHLAVRRRPRIAIIDSGDELAASADRCAAHQVPASNGAMLAALAAELPCQIDRLGPVADDMDALAAAFARANEADLIVTSGGASVGDHDLVRPALAAWGAEIDFWRVAIKPGKPLLVATRHAPRGRQIVLGLPGNPVSSHVTAYLFMLPLIRALLGSGAPLPRPVRAALAAPLRPGGERREFLRARWDGETIAAQSLQDSGALSALAHSNALIDRPADAPAAPAGTVVSAFLLENGAIA